MSQTKHGKQQARAYYYGILGMLGLVCVLGGGIFFMIRTVSRSSAPPSTPAQ